MIKSLVFALLVAGAALGASTAVQMFIGQQGPAKASEEDAGLDEHGKPQELQKTRVMNVPVIKDGKIQGYVIAQFSYRLGKKDDQKMPPEPFLMDEAFSALYADDKLDFRHLETYDLKALTQRIKMKVNERIGASAIREVLVQDFTYIAREDIQ